MSIGLSFGSATSGTGFDVASTVASIVAVARAPETAWQARATALGKQDTVLTTLGSDLSSLSNSLSSLTNFDGVFASKQGSVSDPSVATLIGASAAAVAGTHTLAVGSLAQTSSQFSDAVAAGDLLTGTLTIQVGNGTPASLALDSSGETLAQLAAQINHAGAGVTANVLTDSSGSRLSLVSATGGAAGQITLGGTVSTSSGSLTFQQAVRGSDAQYTLDGVSLSSSTNLISTALPGVQFQLGAVSASPVTLQIVNDTSAVASALSSFVSAYNTLLAAVNGQEAKDSTGAAEPLFGNPVIATLQQQLSSAFTVAGSGGSTVSLASLGLGFDSSGALTLDSSALSQTLETNFDGAAQFFQQAGSFGQQLSATFAGLSATGSSGVLAAALKQNSDEESSIQNDTAALESRLSTYQASLTAQLTAANQILQAIPQKLDEVNQIYAAITGYNTGK